VKVVMKAMVMVGEEWRWGWRWCRWLV